MLLCLVPLVPEPCTLHMRRFHTDPSGTYVKYEAKAIGSGSEGAQTALQVRSMHSMHSTDTSFPCNTPPHAALHAVTPAWENGTR